MANYATTKAALDAAIRTNGVQAITGAVLNTILNDILAALGKHYQFGGLVTPDAAFTAGDEKVAFFAVEAGTYTNFGGVTLDGKSLHILTYDSTWHDADTLIPSGAAFEAALALAIKGSQSGIAEGIADTISAGTAQEFLQRQSGGDGVNCIKRIKGKTIAWNQLVGPDTTEVTIPSGHKYFAIIGGTASVATSDGTAIAVTGGVDIVTDLTLLGLGDLTAAQFEALYPALYYAPASVLKSNDAAALLTDGRNQWDEVWEVGYWDASGWHANSNFLGCKNRLPVLPNTAYYWRCPINVREIEYWDAANNYLGRTSYAEGIANTTFTTPANCTSITFYFGGSYGTTYKNDICINISDPSFNGTYQPYWQRVLALRLSELTGIPEGGTEADRVTMFPNGLRGLGTSYDEIAGGKATKRRSVRAYESGDESDASVITDGTNTDYALATPIVYTDLQYADGTPFTMPATILVDNGGTERIQAPEGATTPSAPFCCDSNYSIGVANLVKRLAALENAE